MKKKETTLSVLKEIRDSTKAIAQLLKANNSFLAGNAVIKPNIATLRGIPSRNDAVINLEGADTTHLPKEIEQDQLLIYIPEITMKEVVEKAGNKKADGSPLMRNTSWYKKETFYTQEKTRKGWYLVGKELMKETRSKTWNEQEVILKEKGSGRFNAAEILYILYAYNKQTGKCLLPTWNDFYWTSSLSAFGVVAVGACDADGVNVYGCGADGSGSDLGVCFSRSVKS